jgi:hypothetical protein
MMIGTTNFSSRRENTLLIRGRSHAHGRLGHQLIIQYLPKMAVAELRIFSKSGWNEENPRSSANKHLRPRTPWTPSFTPPSRRGLDGYKLKNRETIVLDPDDEHSL